MLIAVTRAVSDAINRCELTHLAREPIDVDRARAEHRAYERALCDRFHKLYYDRGVWLNTRWLATPVQKLPLDLWLVQELVVELRPDLLIDRHSQGGLARWTAAH